MSTEEEKINTNLSENFTDIKNAFGGLWQSKERGNTLEIITPYATTNNRFVSVFLSKSGNNYVISDGGWLNRGFYEVAISGEPCVLKVFCHFQNSFGIEQNVTCEGIPYYFLTTANVKDIPSKLFNLALFIQNIVSISEIVFEDKM